MPAWLIFLAALLLPLSVQAVDSVSQLNTSTENQQQKPALSENMQALLATISTADIALEKSREYQQKGQFGLAKIVLQHGIELAKLSGSEFVELVNEMEYALPMLQAREQLVLGEPEQAEKILQKLSEQFSSDQRRSDEIAALKGALPQSRILASAQSNNERDVTRNVRQRLGEYYVQYGEFPNFTELNKLLPPADKIFQGYEIAYYQSNPNAYRLVLRNKRNSENLLKIEATRLSK